MIVRLGVLFVRGAGRRGIVRMVLLAAGAAAGMWCLLAGLMVPHLLDARQDRAEARIPRSAGGAPGKGSFFETARWWDERPFTLTFLADVRPGLAPPGVDQAPEPGEAVVSPALVDELRASETLANSFPYDVTGEIAPEGLISPDELFAYVGADKSDLPETALGLSGFGENLNPDVDIAAGDRKTINLAFLGLVGIPLCVYFGICARLSAASRDRRLAALRLLGLTRREAHKVNAFEVVSTALLGGVAGAALFAVTSPPLSSLGIGGIVWFPEDASPPAFFVIAALLGIGLAAWAFGKAGARRAIDNALFVRRQSKAPRLGTWRLLPLVLGMGLLLGLVVAGAGKPVGEGTGNLGPLLLMVGVFLGLVGLALGFGVVAVRLGQQWAERTPRLATRLGMKRLAFDPSGSIRVVTGLVVVVFGLGFANGLQRDAQAVHDELGQTQVLALFAAEVPAANRAELRDLPEVDGMIVHVASRSLSPPPGTKVPSPSAFPLRVMWGTCNDLEAFLEHPISDCEENTPYRILPATGQPIAVTRAPGEEFLFPRTIRRTDAGPTFSVGVPERKLLVPRDDIYELKSVEVLLPPDRLPGGEIPATAEIELATAATPEAASSVMASVAALAPTANLSLLDQNVTARRQARVVQRLLWAALALGFLVGIAAFFVAAVDQAVERRANVTSLRIVGLQHGTLRGAQSIQVTFPLAVGAVVALAAGKIAEQATVAVGGYDKSWAWHGTLVSAVIAIAAVGVAAALTRLSVRRKIEPELIRRE